MCRIKFMVDVLPGYAFPSEGFIHGGGIRLLRGINVAPGSVEWGEVVYSEYMSSFERYALRRDDIIIGMDRPWISGGLRVAMILENDLPSLLVQRVARLRCGREVDPGYLELCLRSRHFLAHFEPDMTGVSVPHISDTQIGNFRIPLPSMENQILLVQRTGSDLDLIGRLLAKAHEVILRLQERRSALITAAVTGQIDVTDPALTKAAA